MKPTSPIRVALLTTLGLSLLLPRAASAQNAGNIRVARLARAEGQVLVSHAGSGTWEEAPVNLPLQEGDTLATQDGLAGIEFDDGSTAFLAANSVLQFTQLGFSNGSRATVLTLTQGAGSLNASITNQDSFRVRTLTFDVTISQRAEFRVDAFLDGASAEVFNGNVFVTTTKGSTDLAKGQSIAVHESDFQDLYRGRLESPDPFDQWVIQEGDRIRAGNKNTLNYISPPNSYGLSELAIYGTWLNYEFGGFVWRPFRVGLSWTPYLNGYWRLDPLLGWIWVSSEQWGWMPYHFGAWLLSPVLGWVWVPGGSAGLNQWQAARVNWVSVGNHVGWVAISPNDRENVPANTEHGVITISSASPKNGTPQNQLVSGQDLRNLEPLKQPPQEFVSGLGLGPSGQGTGSKKPIGLNARSDNASFPPEQPLPAVANGSRPPVAAAEPMPQSRAGVPRVTQPRDGQLNSQINRDFVQRDFSPRESAPSVDLPPAYLPGSAARGSIPVRGNALSTRPVMSNVPNSLSRPVTAPVTLSRPVTAPVIPGALAPLTTTTKAPQTTQTAPVRKNSGTHAAAKAPQPSPSPSH